MTTRRTTPKHRHVSCHAAHMSRQFANFSKMVAHMSVLHAYELPFWFFFPKWLLTCRVVAHMSCHFAFFLKKDSSHVVPYAHMSCHIWNHMSENRSYAQPKFQFDAKSRFICRTYAHEAKSRYINRLSRYMSVCHDI
jgi:hypothetical protein